MMKVPLLCSAMLAAVAFFAGAAQAVQPDEFVRNTIRGDSGEITLGQIAQQRAVTPEVRDYAAMLVRDHTSSRDQFSHVAWMVHVHPDWHITADGARQQHKLLELRGRDFDREYLRMMVDDHNTTLRDFRSEAGSHNRGEPAAIAARLLPTLEHHLQMAVTLQRHLEDRLADGNRGPGGDHAPGKGGYGDHRDRNGNGNPGNWHPR
jgi:putative membrane protein